MNREDVIRTAREAGLLRSGDGWTAPHRLGATEVERFAVLVAAAEREACEKECQEQADLSEQAFQKATRRWDQEAYRHAAVGARFCLARIRARGEK